jgi:hypothetical protein
MKPQLEHLEARELLTTFYVATTGSDGDDGTLDAPFRTLNYAVGLLHPGDTLLVRGGTYREWLNSAVPGGTSWSAPVTIAAYPGEMPVLRPAKEEADQVLKFASGSEHFISIEGLVLDAARVLYDAVKITAGDGVASHIRLLNCEIMNAPQQGVLVTQVGADYNEFVNCKIHDNGTDNFNHGMYLETSHNLVDGCEFYNNAGYGIQIYKGNGVSGQDASYNLVENCVIHDNGLYGNSGSSGIGLFTGVGNEALGNTVYNNPRGIATDYGASETVIQANVVYGTTQNAAIYIGSGSTEATVADNDCHDNQYGDFHDDGENTVATGNNFH